MHSRERSLGGWSAILGAEEEPLDEEPKTDPHLAVSSTDFAEVDGPPTSPGPAASAPKPDRLRGGHAPASDDPALAALEELDGEATVTPEARARARAVMSKRNARPSPPAQGVDEDSRTPAARPRSPAEDDAPPLEPTPKPARRLKLPVPGQRKHGERSDDDEEQVRPGAARPVGLGAGSPLEPSSRGSGGTDPALGARAGRADLGAEGAGGPSFSGMDDLAEQLSEPLGSASARQPKGGGLAEYKEVIRVAVVGAALIGAAIAFQVGRATDEPQVTAVVAPEPRGAPPGTSTAAAEPGGPRRRAVGSIAEPTTGGVPASERPGETAPRSASSVNEVAGAAATGDRGTQRSKTPMITIVSTPPGALVEINGELYGNTPIIRPAPTATQRLSLRLKLDHYKKWEGDLSPNEAGHFSVNVRMEPLR